MKPLKNLFTVSLIAMLSACNAQIHSWIQISNPAPRAGEELNITLRFDTLMPYNNWSIFEQHNFLLKSDVTIYTGTNSNDTMWVGPFIFKINGRELITDSLPIYVAEQLKPSKDTIAIWQTSFNGKDYLVIEQIIFDKTYIKTNFADFDPNSLCNKIPLIKSYSTTLAGFAKNYKKEVFEIQKKKRYNGDCEVTIANFKNVPEYITIQNYQIK